MIRLLGGNAKLLPVVVIPTVMLVSFVAGMNAPFIFGPILIPIAQAAGMDLLVLIYMIALIIMNVGLVATLINRLYLMTHADKEL